MCDEILIQLKLTSPTSLQEGENKILREHANPTFMGQPGTEKDDQKGAPAAGCNQIETVQKSLQRTFKINSGWVLTNPIALQIGWIRERRPE